MKLLLCVVFASVCLMLQAEESPVLITLRRVFNYLEKIQNGMVTQNISSMSSCPSTSDIQDCCIASALECFRSRVQYLTLSDRILNKFLKIVSSDLSKSFIRNGTSWSCSQKATEEATCRSCDSFPKVQSINCVRNLQTLLQKIFSLQV